MRRDRLLPCVRPRCAPRAPAFSLARLFVRRGPEDAVTAAGNVTAATDLPDTVTC